MGRGFVRALLSNCYLRGSALAVLAAAALLGASTAEAQNSNDDNPSECSLSFSRSSRPLNVASYFTWYHSREQFDCMSSRPLEGWFLSKSRKRAKKHFGRLERHGFDAILAVIYADPSTRKGGSADMRHMLKSLKYAKKQGLQFIPLFDLAVAASHQLNLCNRLAGPCEPGTIPVEEYNFDRHMPLQDLTIDMLTAIADQFILPYMNQRRPLRSTARFLTTTEGKLVLDEEGLPRPEIYLYIARAWTDNSRGHHTIKNTLRSVIRNYRKRGLGKPAFTLDVIQATHKSFDADLVAAFGDSVVGITSFFETSPEPQTLGQLVREVHEPMYARAREKLADLIASGTVDANIQISPGMAANFDKRKWASCNGNTGDIAWPAMGPEDVYEAFFTGMIHTAHPTGSCTAASGPTSTWRNKRYVYAGEGFEGTWLCAERGPGGTFHYPNQYGCQPLHIFEILLEELGER
jgi:hypothetical protein